MPALATLLGHCSREPARYAPNPPMPSREPPAQAVDAGAPEPLPPQRVDLDTTPPMQYGGAPMPVTPMPHPAPAPAPAPAPHAAMAPSAPIAAMAPMALAPAASMVTIVHNHPPGTACRPLSVTELRQAAQRQAAGGG
jgi:hypothetical protein